MESTDIKPRIVGYGSAVRNSPSPRNEELLERFSSWFMAADGPVVGDYVLFPEGSRKNDDYERDVERFSHDWGDVIQTSPGGSFHIGDGYVSFSGGLNPGQPKERFVLVEDEWREGGFWFFDGNYARAYAAVNVLIPCRVFRYVEE